MSTSIPAVRFEGDSFESQPQIPFLKFREGEKTELVVVFGATRVQFIHKPKFTKLPGLELNVLCGQNCPLCKMGKWPQVEAFTPAVDDYTGVGGLIVGYGFTKPIPNTDVSMAPVERLQVTGQHGDLAYSQVRFAAIPKGGEPECVKLHALTPFKFEMLFAKVEGLAEEAVPVLKELVERFKHEADGILLSRGSSLTPEEIARVPSVSRILAHQGLV